MTAVLVGILLGTCVVAAPEPAARIVVVGSNSLADAAMLNNAIAASPTGSEIILRGEFLLDATVRLLADRAYTGESRAGTVLRQADGANLPAVVASAAWLDNTAWTGNPLAIRRLTIDGNRRGNQDGQTAGLVLRNWLSAAEDLHIRDCASDGLRLASVSLDNTGLTNTQVNGRIADCFTEHSGRHGVYVEDPGNAVTDWILRDCWIASSGQDGIHLENAAGWIVERNHIYGVGQHGLWAARLFGTSICDNYIEGFGETTAAGDWHGLRVTLQGDAASVIAHNRIFCFGGERQEQSTYRYLTVRVNYGVGLVAVTGNVIRGPGGPRGVGLDYGTDGDRELRVTSSANAVEGVATPLAVGAGVQVTAGL